MYRYPTKKTYVFAQLRSTIQKKGESITLYDGKLIEVIKHHGFDMAEKETSHGLSRDY
jgi:hypothetical protein